MYDLNDPTFVELLAERARCRQAGLPEPPLPGEHNLTGLFRGSSVTPDKQTALIAHNEAEIAEGRPPTWLRAERRGRPFGSEKYPFSTIPVGGTFWVDPGQHQPQWQSFRIHCHKRGKALGMVFRCHKHKDGRFEVYRER